MKSMQCKYPCSTNDEMFMILIKRFAKVRAEDNPWVDEIKPLLCQTLIKCIHLVTIFKFDSKRHNGNLEDAILEALLNG